MRFRAQLSDAPLLSNLLSSLSSLTSTVLLLLDGSHIRVIIPSEFTSGEQVFLELNAESITDTYRIESKSDNQILMIAKLKILTRAVASGNSNVGRIIFKLSKKGGNPYLTFDITSSSMSLIQDVPVAIQSPERIPECQEPDLPPPTVKIRMPPLNSLKKVIERMKSVSDQLILTATNTGDACFEVQSDMVTIKTFYRGLSIQQSASQDEKASSQSVSARACMSIKKFANVLQCKVVHAAYILGCIVEGHAFVLYVKMSGNIGIVTYYIPLVAE